MALFTCSNFSIILAILFGKLAKTPAIAEATLVLSHIRNRLSAQSTHALLCLVSWSLLGYVKDTDITAVTVLPEVEGDKEDELEEGWDRINL